MNKGIVSLALLGATTSLMAMYAEHAYLYKDPRIMGMGGTNVAVGAYSTSIFSNPAGLTNIKKDHGFVVDLLGMGVDATAKTQEFINDLNDVDSEDTDAMIDVLTKYSGEHFHEGMSNYSAISKNSDAFAWSIGFLAAADGNIMAHGNGGVGFLETTTRVYGGLFFGAAKPYDTKLGRIDIGIGLKYITQKSYEGVMTANYLVQDDFNDKLKEDYEREASGIGLDLGVNYYPFANSSWHPAFGLSIMNIGSMSMDDNYGGQPMTINLGASVTPELKVIDKLVIAVDYVDILNANQQRTYLIDGSYEDSSDTDFMKRLRFGMGLGLIDTSMFATTLNVGMYQSAYTAGVDMQLTFLKLNVATYEEQVGLGSADISDRRYMAQIGIGW